MDEPRSESPPSSNPVVWRDWQWLLLLACFVVPLRACLFFNTEVMARDSVGYVRYALRFEEKPYGEVLRTFDQHPAYPLAIWAVSMPLRAWGGTTPEVMQWSAQLVSALAAVLLIVPMYYLGKALWDARIGFGGALLYQILPMSGHHLSDGMSESLFVMFVAWSLWCGVRALQNRGPHWFIACGALSGLAYLTRPEGAVVLAAVALTLACFQLFAASRERWLPWLAQCACLIAPALLVGSLYVVPTGSLTNKPSIQGMADFAASSSAPSEGAQLPGLWAQLWADSFIHLTSPTARLMRGARALILEIGYALHYLGCVPLVIALIWQRKTLLRDRAAWAVVCYFCLHAAALLLLARSAGYLSDRHLMSLIMLLCYPAMLGIRELAGWISAWKSRGESPRVNRTPLIAMAILGLLVAVCVPQTLKRLHGNRAGNHAIGLWLREQLQGGDLVLDDHDWSNYYAGQMFIEGKEPSAPPGYHPKCYVVITRSNDPKVAKIRRNWERRLEWSKGEIVRHWPLEKTPTEARVVVYMLPRDPRTHPWKVAQN
jgi:hypothetical protein